MAGVFISVPGEDAVMTAQGGLVGWAERSALRRAGSLTTGGSVPGRLRFVFYGRVSTEDWQDPVTSRARQREQAEALVRGHGVMVRSWERSPDSEPPYRLVLWPSMWWRGDIRGQHGLRPPGCAHPGRRPRCLGGAWAPLRTAARPPASSPRKPRPGPR